MATLGIKSFLISKINVERSKNHESKRNISFRKRSLLVMSNSEQDNKISFKRIGQQTVALSAAALLTASQLAVFAPPPVSAVSEEQLLFLEAWRAVDRAYVDKSFNGQSWFRYKEKTVKSSRMNDRDETYDVIRAMLASLDDPFTRFLEPAKYTALVGGTSRGSVTGVGVEVGFQDGPKGQPPQMVIVAPSAGGPAEKAGVAAGDLLVGVDQASTSDMGLYDVAQALQGPEGSSVVVKTSRGKDKFEYTLTRESIALIPVSSTICPATTSGGKDLNFGVIRISTFNSNTTAAVDSAIKQLQSEGATAFALDVRNNGGGLFTSGVELAKMFMNKGVIVNIADTTGVRDVYEADGTALAPRAPVVMVVNKGTASASEVLSGALQDNGRAKVLGERTFGKGLIQTIVPLSDGSAVVVTVARYQTPSGTDINKIGITPDIDISLPSDSLSLCTALSELPQAPKLLG